MTAPSISLRDVSKRFGTHDALTRVSLDVSDGEVVVIVGPSGCGKTTLLRLVAGLETPDEGEIFLGGTLVAAAGKVIVPPYGRGVGFVFQDLALWPHLTVREQLDFVLGSSRVPRAERPASIESALRLVQSEPLARRYPHQLSGGEQQRVALARAVVGKPRLFLLDEPLSSLDPELRSALRAELKRLQRQLHVTAVYVTHDREDAAALAGRVVQMRAGRIVADSAPPPEEERA